VILDFQNRWQTGKILKVRFLNGEEELHERVLEAAKQWEDYANITFELADEDEDAEVRVKFSDGKNDSKIGTDSLTFAGDQQTVSFNSLNVNSSEEDVNMYVLHEFGHTLGFIHEHLHPTKKIDWEKNKAIEYYANNYGYTEEDCEKNLFRPYVPSSLLYSEFDPDSIMMYPIPPEITNDGSSFIMNSQLSEMDKRMAEIFYPDSFPKPKIIAPDPDNFIRGELKEYSQYNVYGFGFEGGGLKCYVEAEAEAGEEITLALYSIEPDGPRKGCINYMLPNEEYQGGRGNMPLIETYPSATGDLYVKVAHIDPAGKAKYKLKVYLL
jgi:hypothetical protein